MKRRDFIVKSGLVTSGLAVGSSVLWGATNGFRANNTINIGVIGTGDRGAGLTPFLNEIEGVNVIACCDILPFRLENGLKKAGAKAKGYNDYRKLLDNKDIDAVLVSTPFNTHSKISIDALDANKHVYCEKTMAKGFEAINALVKKEATSSVVFQTGHQYHSSRLYSHVVNLIKEGKIGKIVAFECQWNRNGNWRRPVPDPSLERAINWRMYREYSGGLVAELCSHQIDFVNWVLGENPEQIQGVGGIDYWKDGRETYDNIHLIYKYPSGVKATFRCLTSNALGDYQIKVYGDKGTILIDYVNAWVYYEKGIEKELGEVDGVSGATVNSQMQGKGIPIHIEHNDPSKQALIDFRDSIVNNTEPISNIHTGANTAKAVQMSLDAMYKDEIIYCDKIKMS
ncbi:Gfo/Idh/MocA family oxidoreductase [Tamlana fucoidanivorans]|uniref:Gfo/Idh/MocA family oxidoreductase n=1 Tax=Allotamlana fucoidanivorans TaxID=2583814 RepID=A0A5C4SMB1_9FLAO|nr:Gfo/Idh/MocA family oxidoreductase [Tamlana fucoidanivorans]TNJ44901.1 Gfo/Idh/MocA family oxidoreductase [Tamlana fucoidanivorans]